MATKRWLLGKHLTSITIATGTEAAEGTVSWSSTVSLANIGDYIRVTDQRQLEQISSVDATFANYEKTLNDSTLSVGEILRVNVRSVLEAATATADLIKVVFVRGTTTWTYIGQVESFEDGVSSQGKNTVQLNLKPKDTGTAPVVSTSS